MSVRASITLGRKSTAQCHVYATATPILALDDGPGYSVTIDVRNAQLPERQIELADQLAAAAAQFAAATRAHYQRNGDTS